MFHCGGAVPQPSGGVVGHRYCISGLRDQADRERRERKLKRFADRVSGRVLNCCFAPAWATLPVRHTRAHT